MAGERPMMIGERYALLRLLGSGGMAEVWLATDERLNGKQVAVKRLHGIRVGTQESAVDVERARREAFAASRVSHPNLVAVTDFVAEGGEPFIVMEYIEGTTLADLCGTTGLPAGQAAAIIAQVADALAEAHRSHIVHRDVKPANIMVTSRGVAKLADFGIARTPEDSRLTQTGFFTGTMSYLAPEVLDGGEASPASDVWALGATLYETVEGRPAFTGETTAVLIARIVMGPGPAPMRDRGLAPLVDRMLSRDPSARPGAEEVSRELRARAAASSVGSTPAPGASGVSSSAPVAAAAEQSRSKSRSPAPEAAPNLAAATVVSADARVAGTRAPSRPRPRPKTRGRIWLVAALPAALAAVIGVSLVVANQRDSGAPVAGGEHPPVLSSSAGTPSAEPSRTDLTSVGGSPTDTPPIVTGEGPATPPQAFAGRYDLHAVVRTLTGRPRDLAALRPVRPGYVYSAALTVTVRTAGRHEHVAVVRQVGPGRAVPGLPLRLRYHRGTWLLRSTRRDTCPGSSGPQRFAATRSLRLAPPQYGAAHPRTFRGRYGYVYAAPCSGRETVAVTLVRHGG